VSRFRVLSLLGLAGLLTLVAGPLTPVVRASPGQVNGGPEDTLDAVMNRAVAAVASFETDFAAVLAEEHLVQQASGTFANSRRDIRADLLLMRLPGQDGWAPFRDVYEVNRRPVRDRTERLRNLFVQTPETAVNAATQISNESSRYNIDTPITTITVPTFGLMLLTPANLQRFEFRKRGEEQIAGVTTWRVGFVELTRPTLVRTLRGDDVTIEGSLWIDPLTGRVIKTLVKTLGTPDPGLPVTAGNGLTLMWVEVTFARNEALGLWVPEKLTEWARTGDNAVVAGTSTYARFRRLAVKTTETLDSPQSR
jgi:hypothetical protein